MCNRLRDRWIKEAVVLASEIRLYRQKEGRPVEIGEVTLERNCDPEYGESETFHS